MCPYVAEMAHCSYLLYVSGNLGQNESLERIDRTVDWQGFCRLVQGVHGATEGRPSYPPLMMVKVLLLEQWYVLSDPQMDTLAPRSHSGGWTTPPITGLILVDWSNVDEDLLAFTRSVIDLRQAHLVFHRRHWFQGRPIHGVGIEDCAWFQPSGEEMSDQDWEAGYARSLGVFINGAFVGINERSEEITGDSSLLLFNAHNEPVQFRLPDQKFGREWNIEIATQAESEMDPTIAAGTPVTVGAHAMMVLARTA